MITVGCSDDDREVLVGGNRMVDYSGRGPTAACICKPDLVAPGCSVVSCSSRADKYTIKSGTSMSTPIVSGAVALLLERFPDMTNKDVKTETEGKFGGYRAAEKPAGMGTVGCGENDRKIDVEIFL